MNAIVLAILVMVALSLARVSVVFALIVAALVGGLVSGMSVSDVLVAFNDGLGNGATIALAYATLGAFAWPCHARALPNCSPPRPSTGCNWTAAPRTAPESTSPCWAFC